ncbi:hypothetical protein SUDANB95_04902 [Actinosynnema sp. ALI-1.44]
MTGTDRAALPPVLWDPDPLSTLNAGTMVVTSPRALVAAVDAELDFGAATVVRARDTTAGSIPAGTRQVVALGGGSTIDAAKLLAHEAGLPLIVAPTVLSTDAAFSSVAARRRAGSIDYVETGCPNVVVLHRDLLDHAPWEAHLHGLGDLLAVEPATRDQAAREPGQSVVRTAARSLVTAALDLADLWRAPSPEGYGALVELLRLKVQLGLFAGHPELEEGTEHYLGYALEPHLTGFVWHGALLINCLPVCAVVQNWDAATTNALRSFVAALPFARDTGAHLVSAEDFEKVLREMPGYCGDRGLTNTVLAGTRLGDDVVRAATAAWVRGW